jgi:4-amino-4-deoxychorismate lyase
MSLLFESIRVANGKFENLVYHEQRMKRSLKELFGHDEPVDLEEQLRHIPIPADAIYKCRIVYNDTAQQVEFQEYRPRKITSLKAIEHDRIQYDFKYTDRSTLNHLFSLRENCDDVIIVKRGLVTDASYANVAFKKGKEWFTPWQPLLKGTMRQALLEYNRLKEEEISKKEIRNFDAVKIFNAMLRFDSEEISIDRIIF